MRFFISKWLWCPNCKCETRHIRVGGGWACSHKCGHIKYGG